jgi:hypothetical protein
MHLEQLSKRLETANLGTRGVNIFVHFMPATVTKGLVLLPSLAGDPINWELPGWHKANSFQIIVRDTSVDRGYQFATSCVSALTITTDTILAAIAPDIPAIQVRYIRPRHDVVVLPRSPSNYFEFSINFESAYSDIIH